MVKIVTGFNAGKRRTTGFTMIEVLVALFVLLIGLLGLAGLQARTQTAEFESYQRVQALVLLEDMLERIETNRATTSCFAFTTNTGAGTPFLGATGTGHLGTPACGASITEYNTMANTALTEWDNLLQGTSEYKGSGTTNPVGAMIGARGCVSYDATTVLKDSTGADIPGTGIYTIIVVWQGMTDTAVPTVNCANGLYDPPGATTSDLRRRAVSRTFRLGKLS